MVSVWLATQTSYHNGVQVITSTVSGSTYLTANAGQPNAAASLGTVKTSSAISRVTDGTSNYTVPTVNAVHTYVGGISNNYVSTVTATAPIYVSRSTNSLSIWIAYNTDLRGGTKLSTYATGGSTYLIASTQQPNAAAAIGTVKTSSTITWVTDTTSNYTVPTVNAVSKAIVSAIYTQLPGQTVSIVSNIYTLTSDFVPWHHVRDDSFTYDVANSPYINTLGAQFYINKHGTTNKAQWELFPFNEPTDGDGWYRGTSNITFDNFGVVTTWDVVSRINVTLDEYLPIASGANAYIHLEGNPGDKWVVPTVNAVYDAIASMTSHLSTVTSIINHVSDIYIDSHFHSYITHVSNISNFYYTYVSEFHSTGGTGGVTTINAYSGVSAVQVNSATYNIYGITANNISYGMVKITTSVVSLADNNASSMYTVPHTNAVWSYVGKAISVSFDTDWYNGVKLQSSASKYYAYARPASAHYPAGFNTKPFGVVKTMDDIPDEPINSAIQYKMPDGTTADNGDAFGNFIVPTLNAVVRKFNNVPYLSNIRAEEPLYVTNVYLNRHEKSMYLSHGGDFDTGYGVMLTLTSNYYGHYRLEAIARHPNGYVLGNDEGTVKTYSRLVRVTDATSDYTVPTVNAVLDAIGTVSVGAEPPLYMINKFMTLQWSDEPEDGVTLATRTANGVTYLIASARHPNATAVSNADYGTVRTSSALNRVTDGTSNWTVPTVNAVIAGIGACSNNFAQYGKIKNIGGVDPIYTSNNSSVGIRIDSDNYRGGVRAMVSNVGGLIKLIAVGGQPDAGTSYGTVKTSSKLTKVTDTTSNCTVPTVNAVISSLESYVPWTKIANAEDGEYTATINEVIDFGARLYVDSLVDGYGNVAEYRKLFAYNELAGGLATVPLTNTLGTVNNNAGAVVTVTSVQYINGYIEETVPIRSVDCNHYLTYAGYPGNDFVVPTVNAVYNAISNLKTSIGNANINGYSSPIYKDAYNSICINTATYLDANYHPSSAVPTASAVWDALQSYGGGGGAEGMLFPIYGSAGGLTYNGSAVVAHGDTVATGYARSGGCWILVSIVGSPTATGCVGISINNNYVPLAMVQGAITQLIPVPSGAYWVVYNGAGTGVTVQVRVL